MKISFLRVVFVTFALFTGAANAGVPTISNWDGSADNGYSASFWNTGVASVFSDWISFSMPVDSSGNGQANTISLGGGGVNFSSFSLYENGVLIAEGVVDSASSYLSFAGGSLPGNYSLNIAGFKLNPDLAASYAGNISISPVPEPQIYAMMLAGLGMLGFSIRRRRNDAFD